MAHRHELSEAEWARIVPLLRPQAGHAHESRYASRCSTWCACRGTRRGGRAAGPGLSPATEATAIPRSAPGCGASACVRSSRSAAIRSSGARIGPGRKPTFDRATYRRRHAVENCVGWLKEEGGARRRHPLREARDPLPRPAEARDDPPAGPPAARRLATRAVDRRHELLILALTGHSCGGGATARTIVHRRAGARPRPLLDAREHARPLLPDSVPPARVLSVLLWSAVFSRRSAWRPRSSSPPVSRRTA
jgi:transposase